MLKIRTEQMQVFEQAAMNKWLLEYQEKNFPKHYEILGKEQARKVIRLGIIQAQKYNVTLERDFCLYINLMLMIGSGFDTDPQIPWAAEILNDQAITDTSSKVKQLYNRAMDYLDQVAGLDNEHSERLLRKIHETPIDRLLPAVTGDFMEYMLTHLQKLYPEKYALVGETNMRRLFQEGMQRATGYGVKSQHSTAIIIGMMFLLGHCFDTDPQFHWAERVLNDGSIADLDDRVQRLYENAKAFLEKWLS